MMNSSFVSIFWDFFPFSKFAEIAYVLLLQSENNYAKIFLHKNIYGKLNLIKSLLTIVPLKLEY